MRWRGVLFKFKSYKASIFFDGLLSQVQAIQNITNAFVFGVQAGLDVNLGKGFGLKSTLSFQRGEEQSADSLIYYPLANAAPLYGSTRVYYQRKALRFEVYSVYNAGMAFEDLSCGPQRRRTVCQRRRRQAVCSRLDDAQLQGCVVHQPPPDPEWRRRKHHGSTLPAIWFGHFGTGTEFHCGGEGQVVSRSIYRIYRIRFGVEFGI